MSWDLADCLTCVGPGWMGLVTRCWDACQDDGSIVEILDIKEKFGGLRFYYRQGNDYAASVVDLAESLSTHVCEVCGALGKVISASGWMRLANRPAE